eukprot:5528443-Prymnesium_polylepis.1
MKAYVEQLAVKYLPRPLHTYPQYDTPSTKKRSSRPTRWRSSASTKRPPRSAAAMRPKWAQ